MYDDSCRCGIDKLMETFGTNMETAYAMMCLEAALYGLHPGDPRVLDMLMNDLSRSTTELTLDLGGICGSG